MPLATILVVDDLAEVLDVTAAILEDAGYATLCCRSSQQALTMLRHGHAIDLLLTDIRMPGEIDGFELAREARALRPLLPIAYLTGFFRSGPENTGVVGPILRKPYRAPDLIWAIAELLATFEDAALVQEVALQMVRHDPFALRFATEAMEMAHEREDQLSAQAWQDIAGAITALLPQPPP
ncbi:MAG: response regulator [Alphaproteobacteria bacterium]|nr:response regulator [Alphaproteobacteria bacterium]